MFLSIVIPTYNNIRIFERCKFLLDDVFCNKNKIELIVTDDSTSDIVKIYLQEFQHIHYVKHERTGNPVDNWNHGIKLSNGRYFWLLHHDEYVNDIQIILNDIQDALYLKKNIIFLKLYIKYDNKISIYKYLWLRPYFLKVPFLLYFMNVIGSPSCYILKNKYYPLYDNRKRWIVDTDYLVNALAISDRYYLSKSPIISDLDNGSIITKSINDTKALHFEEIHQLQISILKKTILLLLIRVFRK
jgi:glycosyltransferase involved in cell wall biosynthesis